MPPWTRHISGPKLAAVCLALVCLLAFGYGEWVALTQWKSGHWYLADVGNIHYCLSNTLHGRFMYSPMHEGNHFAYHFTPFLLLLTPLVALSAYPIPLVSCYVLALALCPVPIYLLSRRLELPRALALLAGVLFWSNHFTASLELANHFEAFLILFFLLTMAFARARAPWFWLFAALALSVKEDAALWMLGFALLSWWDSRKLPLARRFALLSALCLGYLLLAVGVEALLGHHQGEGASSYLQRLEGSGFAPDVLRTALLLLGSFGFLSLFGGRWALLLLLPAPMLLAGFPFTRNQLYYYSYPFLPFLALSALHGMANLLRWGQRLSFSPRRSAMSLGFYVLMVGVVQLPLPTRTDGYRRVPFPVTSRDDYRLQVARELLPARAPALIQFGLFGITPTRPEALMLSKKNLARTDAYVFLDLKSPYGMPTPEYLEIARSVMGEVEAKKRKLIHSSNEIYVVAPRSRQAHERPDPDGPPLQVENAR